MEKQSLYTLYKKGKGKTIYFFVKTALTAFIFLVFKKYITQEVKKDVFWYIEMFYNRKRRHSTLKYMTPIEYLCKYDEIGVA